MEKPFLLLVEDNEDDVELLQMAFRRAHFANDIIVVRDGREALDFLFATGPYTGRNPQHGPQLILLDWKLPKLSGEQVLKAIREREETEFVPVVILTSSKAQEDMLAGYRSGANSYVRKPVNFNDFVAVARQLGLYWFLLNSVPEIWR